MPESYCIAYMYHVVFILFSVNRHLGCFRVPAIANSVAVNTDVHVSFQVMVFSRHTPRSGIAESRCKWAYLQKRVRLTDRENKLAVTRGRRLGAGRGMKQEVRISTFPWWLRQYRICLQVQEAWVRSLGQEDPLEKEMATHSSILAWRIPMDRGAWWATDRSVLSDSLRPHGL